MEMIRAETKVSASYSKISIDPKRNVYESYVQEVFNVEAATVRFQKADTLYNQIKSRELADALKIVDEILKILTNGGETQISFNPPPDETITSALGLYRRIKNIFTRQEPLKR